MQSRIDSMMEVATNIFIGFSVALVTQLALVWAYGLPIDLHTNLQLVGWFTAVSIIRQYVIRRIFNGRSPWAAIKGKFS